jgi:hypothetical protein
MILIVDKIWHALKGIVSVAGRTIADVLHRLTINLFDLLFGFLAWPEKKLRIKIVILTDQIGNPVIHEDQLERSVDHAKRIFKNKFNVRLLPCNGIQFAETIQKAAPKHALHTRGGPGALKEEFMITGIFFRSTIRGTFYPVTAFVVLSIKGATGCSIGPFSDYVTLDPRGAREDSVLAHELAHACGLWHRGERSNLMWRYTNRGETVTWWQKNLFRSSRHVTYW